MRPRGWRDWGAASGFLPCCSGSDAYLLCQRRKARFCATRTRISLVARRRAPGGNSWSFGRRGPGSIRHGCIPVRRDYRWLATRLHGFGQAQPKQVYRKFVETSGAVQIEKGRRIVVYFGRRATIRSCAKRRCTKTVLRSLGCAITGWSLPTPAAQNCHRIRGRGNRR